MAFRYAMGIDDRKAGMYEITCEIKAETDKGLLLDDGATQAWVPKRRVIVEDLPKGFKSVAMPDWLAKEKGFV